MKEELKDERRSRSLHRAGRGPAWSASKTEEVLSALWLIAALLAWNGGIKWLAILIFIKAAMDTACSIGMAILEIRAESKQSPTDPHHPRHPGNEAGNTENL